MRHIFHLAILGVATFVIATAGASRAEGLPPMFKIGAVVRNDKLSAGDNGYRIVDIRGGWIGVKEVNVVTCQNLSSVTRWLYVPAQSATWVAPDHCPE